MSGSKEDRALINQALVDGVGGLQFTAKAPPGLGRLVRIPFYLSQTQAGFAALSGQDTPIVAAASTTHPVVNVLTAAFPGGGGTGPIATLRTPQISWAMLRIVGFETCVDQLLVSFAPLMEISFRELKIGGGATLFVHEDFAPARIYGSFLDTFAGLRDYPILRSPNQAEVQVQAFGFAGSDTLNFSCNLICEILLDDNYGAHIPGPYARPGALVRERSSFLS